MLCPRAPCYHPCYHPRAITRAIIPVLSSPCYHPRAIIPVLSRRAIPCYPPFNTVINEQGSKLIEVKFPSGKTAEVMFNESWNGKTLTLSNAHIEGLKPGDVGPKALFDAAKEYGRQRGAKKIIIEGFERSTGRYKGKTPRPWEFDLE